MKKLALSSKAKTLELLAPYLLKANILPLIRFSVGEYANSKNQIFKKIGRQFHSNLIVRSSSQNEDNEKTSNAGGFDSVMNVDCNDTKVLQNAIDKVIKSYGNDVLDEDEVFVQPMLNNVDMAGVIFSVDIDTLSDYYVVNYDESGSTDSVTSGQSNDLQTFVSFRGNTKFKDKRLESIIAATQECEKIFDTKYLDIEFAYSKNQLYILQVRAIVIEGKNNLSDIDLLESLRKIHVKVKNLNNKHPNLLGDKTIFGVMPDWNPAEIIGLRPKKLALSLYKELITDETWAHQRDDYGYRDLSAHPLLISFLGMPYIDVRVSFNSFIPKNLDENISEKLANYYISKLEDNKAYHDKVEFEIAHSCYYFGIEKKLEKLKEFQFNSDEINAIQNSLLAITNNIIHPAKGLYKKDLEKIHILKQKFNDIVSSNLSLIDKIYWLIKDVKKYGTLPFAGAARAGFIAIQFLKSFVDEGIINKEEYHLFLRSLNTVSKRLVEDKKSLSKQKFIKIYGHLRPGTYDILSKNYAEDYDNYFSNQGITNTEEDLFIFSSKQKEKINLKLSAYKLTINCEQLILFIKEAIKGREHIKFEFTKSLNQILVYMIEFGQQIKDEKGKINNFNKEDLAYLDIQEFMNLYSTLDHRYAVDILRSNIKKNKEFYRYTQAIKLPSLITHSDDIYSFSMDENTANFITLKAIKSSVVNEQSIEGSDISDKIICIKSADPGYDYLFSKNIGGLITCYGGANSHMAIRCSEMGIPAVIGCGERDFKAYSKASLIELDTSNQKVTILK